MTSPNTLHRLPPKLVSNTASDSLLPSPIYQNIEAKKYFHSTNNKTFRGRALIQQEFNLSENNLKCILLKINNDTNKVEKSTEIEKFYEYGHGNAFGKNETEEGKSRNVCFKSLESVNKKLDALFDALA